MAGFSTSFSDITGAGGDIFGRGGTETTTGTTSSSVISTGKETEQLKLDQLAVQKLIEDVLSGPEGLASIFGGEQSAGIFDSSVAAQASGDLAAKLVGELAKLTGERVVTQEATQEGLQAIDQKTEAEEEGLLDKAKGLFGF